MRVSIGMRLWSRAQRNGFDLIMESFLYKKVTFYVFVNIMIRVFINQFSIWLFPLLMNRKNLFNISEQTIIS
jgi:hypothetical protein